MSETVNTEAAPVEKPAEKQEPPTPVAIDVEKIQREAAKAARDEVAKDAEKMINERLSAAARLLSGEPEKKKHDPLLERIVAEPAALLSDIKELTKEELRREMREQESLKQSAQQISQEYLSKYPGLEEHPDYVDALVRTELRTEKDFNKAARKAFDVAVRKLNLKSVDEAAAKRGRLDAIIPGRSSGVAFGVSNQKSQRTSAEDYIKQAREKFASFKRKG